MESAVCRRLVFVFGDQLTDSASSFEGFDNKRDVILMAECDAETGLGSGDQQHAGRSHKQRIAVFFSAMRHFAIAQADKGRRVRYIRVNDPNNTHAFTGELERTLKQLSPEEIVVTRPGEWRVLEEIESWEDRFGVPVRLCEDDHFYTTPEEFSKWASGRKQLVMEYFYREQRKKHGVLMDGKDPVGGEWNFDKDNRESFKAAPRVRPPEWAEPDDITLEVIDLVNRRYPDAPGRLDAENFIWPVTRRAALRWLDEFIEKRLGKFGPYEDAMWTGQPFLYHSMLSVALNLKLLDPRECVEKALKAYENAKAPINSVEGFVRQLIGWREFIRGVYWHEGPDYRDRNSLDQHADLPDFYWTGDTDMRCMAEALEPVLDHAWCHHIPRLMILSGFAMMAGVHPRKVGDWFYAMFADSVDWVTTPNTIGMGMHCDGDSKRPGVVGTKPYAASGKYIGRMSNYCEHCAYDNTKRTDSEGDTRPACPFNTFYWDFLIRNHERFKGNNRMAMILKHVDRMSKEERAEITVAGKRLRKKLGVGPIAG
ncbi:MAG: cryptochrome/photolyase family protein [Phycisphaerales bacterium]|nr:MAG: cryptochrome/photolyase family protein [Phycisphaerales bacterium]